MESMSLRVDWEPAPGVSHPVLARTWSRLELTIGDHCVTTAFDRAAGGSRSGVYGPAFVLAEWIVQSFWFLLYECAPSEQPRRAWRRRHSLVTARQGTSLPNIEWFRDEDVVVAQWKRDDIDRPDRPIRFVESGRDELSPTESRLKLATFVDLVLERVRDLDHPDVVGLRSDWEAIVSAGGDDVTLCKRAARLGLDAFDPEQVSDERARLLTESISKLPEATREDLLDAGVLPARLASSIASIRGVVANGATTSDALGGGAPKAPFEASGASSRAYQRGYETAEELRSSVQQSADSPFDLRAALEKLRWTDLYVEDSSWTTIDPNVKAAVGMTALGRPRVHASPKRHTQQRFVTARAMYALLSGATSNAPRLLTNAGTRTQSASRAFAAELLAPTAAIRARVGDGVDDERIDDLAQQFDVSPMVIKFQIENHALGAG